MEIEKALNPVRPYVHVIGTVVITIAAIKGFGVLREIPGEYWHLAIMGLALRYW